MSFGSFADNFGGNVEDELELETQAKTGLLNVQTKIRTLGDQIGRLSQGRPTKKAVSVMKSLLEESSSAFTTLETQFRRWENAAGGAAATATRRKLILPHLEASLGVEGDKLKRFQKSVEAMEQQLESSYSTDAFRLMTSGDGDDTLYPASQMIEFSSPPFPSVTTDEWTDLPLDHFIAKEKQLAATMEWQSPDPHSSDQSPLNSEQQRLNVHSPLQPQHSRSTVNSAEFPSLHPSVVGPSFYDHADDDEQVPGLPINVKGPFSSSSSTDTGGSGSPCSEEDRNCHLLAVPSSNSVAREKLSTQRCQSQTSTTTARDDFLEDNYLYQSHRKPPNTSEVDYPLDEEEDEELSGLLSRGSVRSASYLDGWHLTVDQSRQDDDLELYVSRERLRGVRRIRAQLSQISNVFRELSHLINEQQDDIDSIDSNMSNIKNSTGTAVDELRKANIIKNRARRRNFIMILVTLFVAAIVLFVYLLPSSPAPSTPSVLNPVTSSESVSSWSRSQPPQFVGDTAEQPRAPARRGNPKKRWAPDPTVNKKT